jgi:hypothetical protein
LIGKRQSDYFPSESVSVISEAQSAEFIDVKVVGAKD